MGEWWSDNNESEMEDEGEEFGGSSDIYPPGAEFEDYYEETTNTDMEEIEDKLSELNSLIVRIATDYGVDEALREINGLVNNIQTYLERKDTGDGLENCGCGIEDDDDTSKMLVLHAIDNIIEVCERIRFSVNIAGESVEKYDIEEIENALNRIKGETEENERVVN